MEPLNRESSKISHLSKDSEIPNKRTKPNLVESLLVAPTGRQLDDLLMKETI